MVISHLYQSPVTGDWVIQSNEEEGAVRCAVRDGLFCTRYVKYLLNALCTFADMYICHTFAVYYLTITL